MYAIDKWENKPYSLYGNKLASKEINEIIKEVRAGEQKNYCNFMYSGFNSLDELVIYYSKSFVFVSEESNVNLGYLIEYDIDSIEKEFSSIEFCVVINN